MVEVDIEELTVVELDGFEEERVWRAILTSANLRKKLITSELVGGSFVQGGETRVIDQNEYSLRRGEIRQIDWLLEIISLMKGQIEFISKGG